MSFLLSWVNSFFTPPMPLTEARKKEIDGYIANEHIFIASKDYCPYCKRAKQLLEKYNVKPLVIELDLIEDGAAVQEYLLEVSGQRTVPNIWIDGKHIGGCDDLTALDTKGELKPLL